MITIHRTPITFTEEFKHHGLRWFRAKTPGGWPLIVPETQVQDGHVLFDDMTPEAKQRIDNLKNKFKK